MSDTGIPGFILMKQLPADGPGEVWLALAENANQPVTLHLLRLDAATGDQDRERFQRQAGICARLRHPRLVNFLTQGVVGATLWFATGMADGLSLTRYVQDRDPLPLDEALDVMDQALDIVDFLHREDTVHRSLQPASFIVKKQSGRMSARLADLGSARCFEPIELRRVTRLGERGYPVHAYTAPETLRNYDRLDPRSDIYGLGGVLYFMLTGRAPYHIAEGHDPTALILESDPPPLLALRPGLPQVVAEVVGRALARDMDARFPSAAAMREALLGATAGAQNLRVKIEKYLSEDELRTVCFDLQIDYASLPGESKAVKALELVAYCERHLRMPELVAACRRANLDAPW